MSKAMGIYVKFYHDHSPNMVVSRVPGLKFGKFSFFFCLILYQTLEKVTKFGGNWLKNKSYMQKAKLGVENKPPPRAYRVKGMLLLHLQHR